MCGEGEVAVDNSLGAHGPREESQEGRGETVRTYHGRHDG